MLNVIRYVILKVVMYHVTVSLCSYVEYVALSDVLLNVIIFSVVRLSVIRLNVVSPLEYLQTKLTNSLNYSEDVIANSKKSFRHCKILQNEPTDRQTDRQTDISTNGQTGSWKVK
jgi:hypothetical protein